MGAIATMFDGIEYRSRLEARWAAFMRNIGWEHTYEPLDGDGYIPDFVVHGAAPFFVEVKPAVVLAEFRQEQSKVERGLQQFDRDVVIVGVTPFLTSAHGFQPFYSYGVSVGWMLSEGDWQPADWITCLHCLRTAIFHTSMSYHSRPCGDYDGDHYLGAHEPDFLQGAWSDACNEVKWRGRAA